MAKKYISKYTGPEIDSGLDNIPKLEGKLTELESEVKDLEISIKGDSVYFDIDDDYVGNYILRRLSEPIVIPKGDALHINTNQTIYLSAFDSNGERLFEKTIYADAENTYINELDSAVFVALIEIYSTKDTHLTCKINLYTNKGLDIAVESATKRVSELETKMPIIDTFESSLINDVKEFSIDSLISGSIWADGSFYDGSFHLESSIKAGDVIKIKCASGSNIRAYVIKDRQGNITRVANQEDWGTQHNYDIEVTINAAEDDGYIYINTIYDDYYGCYIKRTVKAIGGEYIAKNSLPINRVKGVVYNLFDINRITPNSYINVHTGELIHNEGMGRSSSDYIPVVFGESYSLPVYENAMFGNVDRIAMYDKDKVYIGNVQGRLNGVILTITIDNPETKYIRPTIMRSERNKDPWLRDADLMMVVNSATYPNRYYPYGEIVTFKGELDEKLNSMYNPLFGKKVVFDGDSICNAGDADNERGWAYRIGMKNNMLWKNYGIGGGTFTSGFGTHVISETEYEVSPDYIIIDGGTNDADRCGSILNGNIPEKFGSWQEFGYTNNFTTDTFCGAVESYFQRILTQYPSAKVGVIIAQKMSHIKSDHTIYDDTNEDFTAANNNRRAYFEVLMKLCKKWGISYINLWDECKLNPWLHYTYNNEESLYYDGQHLTAKGYEVITPIIESWMKTL